MKIRGLLPAKDKVREQLLQGFPELTQMQGLGGRRQAWVPHLLGAHALHHITLDTGSTQALRQGQELVAIEQVPMHGGAAFIIHATGQQ